MRHLAVACASALFLAALALPSWSEVEEKEVVATVRSVQGANHVMNIDLSYGTALIGFHFWFDNGNHKLRLLDLLPDVDRVHLDFADQNDDDPHTITARWLKFPTPSTLQNKKTKNVRCTKNPCSISIDPVEARNPRVWENFVLQGFRLTRRGGGDANVRQIAIRPDPTHARVEVTYKDNGTFEYDAQIAYTYLETGQVKQYGGTVMGQYLPSEKNWGRKLLKTAVKGRALVQGFDFRFDDGDHHLRELAILPAGYGAFAQYADGTSTQTYLKADRGTGFEVGFSEVPDLRPYTATVDYVVLKD